MFQRLLCTSCNLVQWCAMGRTMGRGDSAQTTRLLLIFLLVNISPFISGSKVQGDCSKDGSCEEKHGKEKYIVKGTL